MPSAAGVLLRGGGARVHGALPARAARLLLAALLTVAAAAAAAEEPLPLAGVLPAAVPAGGRLRGTLWGGGPKGAPRARLVDGAGAVVAEAALAALAEREWALDLPVPAGTAPGKSYALEIRAAEAAVEVASGPAPPAAPPLLARPLEVRDGLSLLLALDKPLYQPGQTVRMRTVAFDPALRSPGPVEVEVAVTGPTGFKVFKAAALASPAGLAAFNLPLPAEPVEGEYEVAASVPGRATTDVAFTVEKYVLPRFEVALDVDQAFLSAKQGAAREVTGSVAARYTYGKQVRGLVNVTLSAGTGGFPGFGFGPRPAFAARPGFPAPSPPEPAKPLATLVNAAFDGAKEFTLSLPDDASGGLYAGQEVEVLVTVLDAATGDVENATAVVRVVSGDVQTALAVDEEFKPGLPVQGRVEATDDTGRAVNATFEVELTLTTVDWRTPNRKMSQRVEAAAGAADFRFEVPLEEAACCNATSPDRAARGCCISNVDVTVYRHDDGAEGLKTWAASECLKRPYSPSGKYLLAEVGKTPKHDEVSLRVSTTGLDAFASAEGGLHYIVVSPGGPAASGRVPWTGSAGAFGTALELRSAWMPEVKVVVYAIADGGEVVGDVLTLPVAAPDRLFGLGAAFNETRVEPGQALQVDLAGGANKTVFLRAVDTSLELLSGGADTAVSSSRVLASLRALLPEAAGPASACITAGAKALRAAGLQAAAEEAEGAEEAADCHAGIFSGYYQIAFDVMERVAMPVAAMPDMAAPQPPSFDGRLAPAWNHSVK